MIWIVFLAAAVGAGWALGHGDAAANARAAAASAPVDLLVALQGLALGLYGRDRIRLRRTYASPALAYLGKRLLLAAAIAAATFALSPVDWSGDSPRALAAAGALGAAVWVGNLPVKL